MAITLKNLCKYAKENYEMIQLVGQEHNTNLVNWVHMLEDAETAEFLHGNELIFTTGIGYPKVNWLLGFVEKLVAYKASGLVINIGPHIEKVPEEVIEYCRVVDFPLFTIPWKTRIVDITNDFCHRIIRAEENEVTVANAFRNAIFFPNNASQFASILERKAFDLEANFGVVVFSMQIPASEDLHIYSQNVRMHLSKILFVYSDRFNLFRQDNQIVVVLQNFPKEEMEKMINRLSEVCTYGGSGHRLYAGLCAGSNGIETLPKSYKRALEVLKMAVKSKSLWVAYEDIGIHQVLIEVEDTQVLERYYKEVLGTLEDYDDKHQSDYFYILKSYLDNNNSVETVAKEMYVHRNTINYKIKKIKEILNLELNNAEVARLLLAYKIKELL